MSEWQYGTVVSGGPRLYFVIERDYTVGDGPNAQTYKVLPISDPDPWARGYINVMRATKVHGDNWQIVWQPPDMRTTEQVVNDVIAKLAAKP